MKLLKNREIRVFLAFAAGAGLIAALVCLAFDWRCAIVCAALALARIGLYIADACRRYRAMRGLAESIDELLAGAENIDLGNYSEGEVSILTNEVTKLTVRLREQASELKKDKQMLADSIADISHQIRTPLTAMNLIAASLRDPTADEGKRREALSELTRQLGRVDWLVSALLKLARLDADAVHFEPAETPLSALAEAALAPLAISMELKNQNVISNISGSAFCDPSWTAEALTNIIKNCSEHMGEGKLFIDAAENPLYSEICIRDTGSGIAKEDLPHLFERFYRGKNSGGSGVGIGLALCRMIVGKQNGTVKAENAKEGGAKFTVRLYKGAV